MRVLWLKTELLHPVNRGGRIRTYQMLRQLKGDHHITYLCLDDESGGEDARSRATEYCHELVTVPFRPASKTSPKIYLDVVRSFVSPLPYVAVRYRSAAMREAIKRLVDDGRIDIVVTDFPFPATNLPETLALPVVLFQHNVEAVIWRRHRDTATGLLRRAFFHTQWRRAVRWEREICRRCDRVIAVSETDAQRLTDDYGLTDVAWVETGVDIEYFRPGQTPPVEGEVVFVGALDWMPNEDGVEWFCGKVWPTVRHHRSDARFLVVGRNPTKRVQAAVAVADGAVLVGEVPDVRPYLEGARVVVVPLRVGGGTRLKIPEALAMESAVVSTPVGAEGLKVVDGEHLLIRGDEKSTAQAILDILAAPEKGKHLGRAGAALVRGRYDWRSVTASFSDALKDVARARGRVGICR